MAKILIVEDNEMNMRLFSDLLKSRGYEVLQCMDGKKALSVVQENHPDLVLMDIQMPGISGLEVTALIRQSKDVAKTKIVAVTAFAMKGDEQKIIDGGCDGYIAKPIAVPNFLETVDSFLVK
ncbi:MAG: response regulator [Alphaproteobacteria bacterium]|nr:response regulator [Alphaproteobacteria bacterium]